jgi:hypothetical protein
MQLFVLFIEFKIYKLKHLGNFKFKKLQNLVLTTTNNYSPPPLWILWSYASYGLFIAINNYCHHLPNFLWSLMVLFDTNIFLLLQLIVTAITFLIWWSHNLACHYGLLIVVTNRYHRDHPNLGHLLVLVINCDTYVVFVVTCCTTNNANVIFKFPLELDYCKSTLGFSAGTNTILPKLYNHRWYTSVSFVGKQWDYWNPKGFFPKLGQTLFCPKVSWSDNETNHPKQLKMCSLLSHFPYYRNF